MAVKRIDVIVFCATALATSTAVATKLKEELDKKSIPSRISTGRISDMQSLVNMAKPDVVVATAVSKMDIGMPIFNGIPLLTGFGVDELINEIVEYLNSKEIL